MGQAKIIILVNEGNVITKTTLKNLTQAEMGMLLSDLELMRQDLLSRYKLNIKRFNKNGK